MKLFRLAGVIALALIACPAVAQDRQPAIKDWADRVVPGGTSMLIDRNGTERGTATNPLANEAVTRAAISVPLVFTGSAAATFGPWAPQLGRPIYAAFAVTGGSASLSVTATTTGSCADGYQLSSANGTFVRGAFASLPAGRYRENLGGESQSGAQWCVTITPAAGATVNGTLGQ